MLKYGKKYIDIGKDYYEKEYQERVRRNLEKRAAALNFKLVPNDPAG
ncbi:hypothetical protein CA85_14600 [Allorhodopirellula solitaria]|uniref:Uncharacterized protein n=1 Tax=Allorhodopirellula solitaria TaxID=2527987 RepID=A0A5C5YDJ1_9BACT|nr:hypothetical protein CA85_14600 [Allorhodopirellula solitaria]